MYRKISIVLAGLLMLSIIITGCSSSKKSTPTLTEMPIQPVSEEISWMIGETTVAATITRPNNDGPHPAIVFVAGSGPTDRNWNSPLLPSTNGSARLLAEELAKAGYISIRYDKRVTGPNAEKNIPLMIGTISMKGHIDELAGAVNQMVNRVDVDTTKIFILANSEGTIHALNYQWEREPKFAGLILTGTPGHSMADLMHSQIEAQVAVLPNAQEIMAGYDKLVIDFLANKPFVADPSLPVGINNLVAGFYQPINLPFTREILTVDPATLIGRVTEPVLVIIGKKDIQVDWQVDGTLLEQAAKENITFVYPDNANHVLKYETKTKEEITAADSVNYNAEDKILDIETVEIIKDWLGDNCK